MQKEIFQTKVSVSKIGDPEDYVNLPVTKDGKAIGVITEVTPRDGYYTLTATLWQNVDVELFNGKPSVISFE
jgi:hypothetical protein